MRARTIVSFTLAAILAACASNAPAGSSTNDPTIDAPPIDLPSLDVPTAASSALDRPKPEASVARRAPTNEVHGYDEPATTPTAILPTELDDLQLPDVASSAPTQAEWLATQRLRTTSADCTARLVREWITIVCTLGNWAGQYPLGIVRVMSGDPTDVGTWTWIPKPKSEYDATSIHVAAVFPVRRGDRRIVELTYEETGAKPIFNHPAAFTISELWLEGMPSPEISVTR